MPKSWAQKSISLSLSLYIYFILFYFLPFPSLFPHVLAISTSFLCTLKVPPWMKKVTQNSSFPYFLQGNLSCDERRCCITTTYSPLAKRIIDDDDDGHNLYQKERQSKGKDSLVTCSTWWISKQSSNWQFHLKNLLNMCNIKFQDFYIFIQIIFSFIISY